MRDKRKVGEILVDAGIIDEMQLRAALGEQSRWGRRLGVTLIKMGMVEEGHLIRALAKQLDLPVASLAGKRIPPEVIALVPARVASEHGVIPLFTKDGNPSSQLFLGMEDPSNLAVLDDLSFRTGMEIHPVMVGPSELGEAIDRYYHDRQSATPTTDPFHSGDTMSLGALRVVTDDTPHPGTIPADEASAVRAAARPRAASAQRPAQAARQVDPSAPARTASPTTPCAVDDAPIELSDPIPIPAPVLPEGLLDDVARAREETERTRIVAKAIAQLLIEKGIVTLDEMQSQIATLKEASETKSESA